MCLCMHCQSSRLPFPHDNYVSVYHAGFHMQGFPHAAAPPLAHIYFYNGWAPYPCSEQPKEELVLDQKLEHKLEEDLKQKEEALCRSHEENEELRQEIEKLRAEAITLSQPQAKISTSEEVAELRRHVRQQQQVYKETESRIEMVERLFTKHAMVDTALSYPDKEQQHHLEEDLKQKEAALRRSQEENEELRRKIDNLFAESQPQAERSTSAKVAELREEQVRLYKEMENRMEKAEWLDHTMVDTALIYPNKEQQHQLEEDLKQKEASLRRVQEDNEELRREIKKLHAESQPQAERSTSAEVAELREQVRLYKEMESSWMEKGEWLHTMVDTDFFSDDCATPALLQAAVDAVKEATAVCANDLFTYTKQHSLPIKLAYLGSSVYHMTACPAEYKRVAKMALQAFLCNLLFHDFEAPDSQPHFERPEVLKSQRLQAYKTFRYVEPADIIHGLKHADPIQERCSVEFNLFFESKLDCFATQLGSVFGISEEEDVQLLTKDATKPSMYTSFLRLARAVWLLHKLAFAFKPASAEIFKVAQDSTFVEEYMQSMVEPESEDDEEHFLQKRVGFMIVPGFTVRNSIIKSEVYLA